MTIDASFLVGTAATLVGTVLMLPQVYKSLKTKQVDDVSWMMLILYVLNCALWLSYGLLIDALPLVITNAIALCIGVAQSVLKYVFSK
ncbi:hypothetical protein K8R03_04865 [Candidatus Kaiserbacteria bacterium]|nr:hypothetical protein [Candidatus Kaiserbacteria bacterium]